MASMEGLEPITVSPQKHDPCWKHCQVFVKNDESPNGVVNKVELKKCLYCGKMFQGGGIHRLKEHLAGRKGNGPICDRAPEDVRIAMQQNLENKLALKRQKMKQSLVVVNSGELDSYSLSNHGQCTLPRVPDSALTVNRGDVGISSDSPACVLRENSNAFAGHAQQRLPPVSFPHSGVLENREEEVGIIGNASSVKRKRLVDEDSYAGDDAGTVSNDLELERVNSRQRIQVAIGRFLYEIGASLDAVKESVYFQPMINALASGGSGITAPSYHDLRGFFLNPKFFYSIEGNMANSIMSGVFDCIERFVSDVEVQDRIVKEMNLYKDAAGDLGRKLAARARDTLLPDPLSFDRKSVVEDWVMEKEINLQDNRAADWMSLDPPSVNSMLLELSSDEAEDFRTGFDDCEILNGLKEVKEEVINMM
ncbi:hypothetical protein TIFTF001_001610 [Ficus carica]|uniref:BED-type domain-containing protein n=1 Tax=Ficus carica TaxID=3494 RepID=A0AA88CRM0_FICCA|nr:hypothetical protein TIFTF001_001610 [Ficus carica]